MNPGSDEAIDSGCTFPIFDNGHGQGCGQTGEDGNPLFWISESCPIHGTKEPRNV